jgi:hypothetical protein
MANRDERQANLTKLGLIALFLGGFAAFTGQRPVRQRHARRLDLPLSDMGLLVLSTFRLGRLAAFDKVFDPIRAPVAATRPDPSGAGQAVVPVGQGARRALGELISCPICAGTWIAAGLVYALHLFPGATRLFMSIMSTVGAAELLNALAENLSWAGAQARQETGDG